MKTKQKNIDISAGKALKHMGKKLYSAEKALKHIMNGGTDPSTKQFIPKEHS